jgi:hypothetical protein
LANALRVPPHTTGSKMSLQAQAELHALAPEQSAMHWLM